MNLTFQYSCSMRTPPRSATVSSSLCNTLQPKWLIFRNAASIRHTIATQIVEFKKLIRISQSMKNNHLLKIWWVNNFPWQKYIWCNQSKRHDIAQGIPTCSQGKKTNIYRNFEFPNYAMQMTPQYHDKKSLPATIETKATIEMITTRTPSINILRYFDRYREVGNMYW